MNEIERMTSLQREANVSDAELARRLHTSQQTIWNWRSRGSIPKNRIEPVALALGAQPEWLLTGRGLPKPAPSLPPEATDLGRRWLRLPENHRKTVSDLVNALLGDCPPADHPPALHESVRRYS